MFEKYVDHRDHRRRRWLWLAIASSVLFHLSFVAFLVVSALWQLDKLSAEQRPVYYAATVGPPSVVLSGSPPPPKAAKTHTKKRTNRLTQPSRDAESQADEQSLTLSDDDPGYGTPDGVPGSNGTDPFGGGGGITGTGTPQPDPIGEMEAPPLPPEKPAPPEIVPAKLIEGSLVSGDPKIHPPDEVRSAMHTAGQTQLVTTVEMCLDRSGRVSRLRLIKSSDYTAYDDKILGEMRSWRYRPYEVNNQAIPICTAITFLYRMHD